MEYIVRFENGNRVSTIACDNAKDRDNKLVQAEVWVKNGVGRVVKVTDKNENYEKLVNDKIVKMSQQEIDDQINANKPKTAKEQFLEMLDDPDVKDKIINLVP